MTLSSYLKIQNLQTKQIKNVQTFEEDDIKVEMWWLIMFNVGHLTNITLTCKPNINPHLDFIEENTVYSIDNKLFN